MSQRGFACKEVTSEEEAFSNDDTLSLLSAKIDGSAGVRKLEWGISELLTCLSPSFTGHIYASLASGALISDFLSCAY